MTIEQLATLAGVDPSTANRWLKGVTFTESPSGGRPVREYAVADIRAALLAPDPKKAAVAKLLDRDDTR